MPSRAKMVLTVLLLLMGGVIAWGVLRTREPDYQGRTLSAWLEDARMDWDSPKADPRTETALRAMGPRALPALVNLVRVRESLFRKALMELSSPYRLGFAIEPTPSSGYRKERRCVW